MDPERIPRGLTGDGLSLVGITQRGRLARVWHLQRRGRRGGRRWFAVKAGMTGLWQVSGRSDLSWEDAVRHDPRHVENWSLSLDLVILLRTMTAMMRSSRAY
ncbi:MAG TPA: sugar transferase [Actinoplanes sp.]|nr:sugar transferase [Actinoplanes sp.]